VPLLRVTSTVAHEAYVVRIGGEGEEYTVITNSTVLTFVPVEHVANYTTAVQAADSHATVTAASE
jgi:hypothetical protein